MEYVVRVDDRGRIVIPSEVRRALNIGRAVRLRVEGKALILEPIQDPLEELSKLVRRVSVKASEAPWMLSTIASRKLAEEGEGGDGERGPARVN